MASVGQILQNLPLPEKFAVVFFVVCMIFLGYTKLFTHNNNVLYNSFTNNTTPTKQRIVCFRCNKDLTDTYNRINSKILEEKIFITAFHVGILCGNRLGMMQKQNDISINIFF